MQRESPETRAVTDLQAACASDGCLICRLLARDERAFFDKLLYEQITNFEQRAKIRKARGFCPAHTVVFCSVEKAPQGAAIIGRSLLGALLESKSLPDPAQPRGLLGGLLKRRDVGGLLALLRPEAPCTACSHMRERTALYNATLLRVLGEREPDFLAAYERSDGLCTLHLDRLLTQLPSHPAVGHVLDHQRARWQHLAEVLDEFVRKHDYRYRGEALTPEEELAWKRTWRLLAGERAGRDEIR